MKAADKPHVMEVRAIRLCLIATVPSTLRVFYRPLMQAIHRTGSDLSVLSSDGPELACFEREQLARTRIIPLARRISPLIDWHALCALLRVLRAEAFDIVHTHTPKAGMLGMLASWLAGVRVRVHTLHGLPLETTRGFKRRILICAERVTCRLAQRVCVVSPSLRNRVLELRLCPAEKMVVLGHGSACGVDLQRFRRTPEAEAQAKTTRRNQGIPDSAVVVGYMGWMVADKGVAVLVEAFRRLAEKRDDLYLLMIGADGSDRDPLSVLTWRSIREHPRIRYVGLQSDPVPWYVAMQICALPTRREGFPYALLEAAAMGIPAIATRVTGCVDAVVDGVTGLLVSPDDSSALQDAMQRLADDAALRTRLGGAAAERVRRHFSSERLVRAHLELYQAMLGES